MIVDGMTATEAFDFIQELLDSLTIAVDANGADSTEAESSRELLDKCIKRLTDQLDP